MKLYGNSGVGLIAPSIRARLPVVFSRRLTRRKESGSRETTPQSSRNSRHAHRVIFSDARGKQDLSPNGEGFTLKMVNYLAREKPPTKLSLVYLSQS